MRQYSSQTPSQTIGPMYGFALVDHEAGGALHCESPTALTIEGMLLDGDSEPVAYPDGMIEVWRGRQFARTRTDSYGRWKVVVAPPEAGSTRDGTALAPYLNVTVFARGLVKQVMTRIYLPENAEQNATDPILAMVGEDRRNGLIARHLGGRRRGFDIRLQGADETVFFDF